MLHIIGFHYLVNNSSEKLIFIIDGFKNVGIIYFRKNLDFFKLFIFEIIPLQAGDNQQVNVRSIDRYHPLRAADTDYTSYMDWNHLLSRM